MQLQKKTRGKNAITRYCAVALNYLLIEAK
jgi:hypothetical protein